MSDEFAFTEPEPHRGPGQHPEPEQHPGPGPHPRPHPRPVTIHVNTRPVTVPAPEVTGLQIKEAAVAQGVIGDTGFQLSRECPNGSLDHVLDDQRVAVDEHSRFMAIAPDDNS